MNLEIVIVIVSFFLVLVAIRGKTFDNAQSGFRKITLTGYLTIIFSLIITISGIFQALRNEIEKSEKEDKISELNIDIAELKGKLHEEKEISKNVLQLISIEQSIINDFNEAIQTAKIVKEYFLKNGIDPFPANNGEIVYYINNNKVSEIEESNIDSLLNYLQGECTYILQQLEFYQNTLYHFNFDSYMYDHFIDTISSYEDDVLRNLSYIESGLGNLKNDFSIQITQCKLSLYN